MLVVEEKKSYGDYGLNLSKYHLNVNLPNWLKPTPKLTPVKTTIVPPKVHHTSFVGKVKTGLGSIFNSIGNIFGQLAPAILQYRLAKEQMKMQANLARLQYQNAGDVPAGIPAGAYQQESYVQQGTGYPASAGGAYYNQPKDNTGKYLLIGGGILAAVLLVTLMHRD